MPSNRLAFSIIVFGLLMAGCTGRRSHGGAIDTTALPKGAEIEKDEIRNLVIAGYRLHTDIITMGTDEEQEIGGKAMVRIDPARWGSARAFRARLGAVFADAVIDSIVNEFGITEQNGKAWMEADNDEDVSDYDETDILDVSKDSAGVTATIEVPLGESGQSDEITVHLRHMPSGWKISNYIFSGSSITGNDSLQ